MTDSTEKAKERTPTAYIFLDLFFGDCGKGASIDAFCAENNIQTVIKFNSGPQSAHNVVVAGVHHTFSQFGSGSFSGAKTVLSEFFAVDPIRLYIERDSLRSKGVAVDGKMFIHRNAPVITSFHAAINKVREVARGDSKHGSCGIGFGELIGDVINNPSLVIRVADCCPAAKQILAKKLEAIQKATRAKLAEIRVKVPSVMDSLLLVEALKTINNPQAVDTIISWFVDLPAIATIISDYKEFLKEDTAFEGGQGFLLDENHGFAPHVTWTDTTARNALRILKDSGFKGVIKKYGITRTYISRHGQGPLPSHCTELSKTLNDPNNPTNNWQGTMRFGHFDFVLATYAANVLGKLDGLFVTHIDYLTHKDKIPVVIQYKTKNYYAMFGIPTKLTGKQVTAEIGKDVSTRQLVLSPELFLRNLESKFSCPIICKSSGAAREDREFI